MKQTINMNLSPRYVHNWTAWEVVREVYANALDADPDGTTIDTDGPDTIIIKTNTIPDLKDLFVIGAGTKFHGDNNIGQFGEGIKLAALVTTRSANASLVLQLPDKRITFSLEDVFDTKVLHAHVEPNEQQMSGYTATIKMTGIVHAFHANVLRDTTPRLIDKPLDHRGKLYHRGIYISDLPELNIPAVFSYNVDKINLNRDRNTVSLGTIVTACVDLFNSKLSYEQIELLFTNWGCVESEYMLGVAEKFVLNNRSTITKLFERRWQGKVAIESDDTEINARVKAQGYHLFKSNWRLVQVLSSLNIPSAETLVSKKSILTYIDPEMHREQLQIIARVGNELNLPNYTIRVAKGVNCNHFCDDLLIVLSEEVINQEPANYVTEYLCMAFSIMEEADLVHYRMTNVAHTLAKYVLEKINVQ